MYIYIYLMVLVPIFRSTLRLQVYSLKYVVTVQLFSWRMLHCSTSCFRIFSPSKHLEGCLCVGTSQSHTHRLPALHRKSAWCRCRRWSAKQIAAQLVEDCFKKPENAHNLQVIGHFVRTSIHRPRQKWTCVYPGDKSKHKGMSITLC